MAATTKRRPGGPRPNGPLLERDQIINEAAEIAREVGLANLSMRLLGERLGVTSMAIYWYVRNRGELVAALAEQVYDTIPRPTDSLPWDEWLRTSALATHTALSQYAGLPDYLMSAVDPPEAAHAQFTRSVEKLVAAGLPDDAAAESVAVLGTFVLARAQLDAHRTAAGMTSPIGLDPQRVLMAGIEQLIDAVHHRLQR